MGYNPPTVTNIVSVSVFLISSHRIYKILHTKYHFILLIMLLEILNPSLKRQEWNYWDLWQATPLMTTKQTTLYAVN